MSPVIWNVSRCVPLNNQAFPKLCEEPRMVAVDNQTVISSSHKMLKHVEAIKKQRKWLTEMLRRAKLCRFLFNKTCIIGWDAECSVDSFLVTVISTHHSNSPLFQVFGRSYCFPDSYSLSSLIQTPFVPFSTSPRALHLQNLSTSLRRCRRIQNPNWPCSRKHKVSVCQGSNWAPHSNWLQYDQSGCLNQQKRKLPRVWDKSLGEEFAGLLWTCHSFWWSRDAENSSDF